MKHIQHLEALKELKNPKRDSEEGTNNKSQQRPPGTKYKSKAKRAQSLYKWPHWRGKISHQRRETQLNQTIANNDQEPRKESR